MIGDLHVLAAGVVEQALLGVQLCQFGNDFCGGRAELGQLLVNGNGFYGKTVLRILVPDSLEVLAGFLILSYPGVEVANSIEDSKIFRIFLDDLFVFGNGVLQLALLDKLLR